MTTTFFISSLWILATVFLLLLILVGLWKFLWFNLKECDYAFRWHGLWKNNLYVMVGKDSDNNCYGINIRYHTNNKRIKFEKVTGKGFALDIPDGVTKTAFLDFVKTLDPNMSPSNRVLLGIVDENQLRPLHFNDHEMFLFHQFKEKLLKVAF